MRRLGCSVPATRLDHRKLMVGLTSNRIQTAGRHFFRSQHLGLRQHLGAIIGSRHGPVPGKKRTADRSHTVSNPATCTGFPSRPYPCLQYTAAFLSFLQQSILSCLAQGFVFTFSRVFLSVYFCFPSFNRTRANLSKGTTTMNSCPSSTKTI